MHSTRLQCISAVLLALLLIPAFFGQNEVVRAAGASPYLSISAEPSPVPVGGSIRLTLRYELPPGARLGREPEIRGIERAIVAGRETGPGKIVLELVADSLEPMKIGPVELGYLDRGGQKRFLASGSLMVKVVPRVTGDSGEMRPIKGIIATQSAWKRWGLAIGIALLVLAAAAGIVFLLQRLSRKGAYRAPQDPPHVRAEKELDALLRDRLFEGGAHKEFYFRFTEIVKRYLEAVRGFPAAEYTTEEIARSILEQDRPLLSVLRHADLVKFADEVPSPARKDDDVGCFLAFIEVTAPRDVKEEDGQGGTAP